MVVFALKVKADMEGVKRLFFPADHTWVLDIQQSNSTERKEQITISSTDEFEVKGSRGTANFVVTWDGCKAQSSMSLYTPSRKGPLKGETLGEYTAEHSGKFVAVAAFECRGVEPINWHPTAKVGYVAENVNGGKHPDVEFYKGDQAGYDWTGYDVEHNLNVEIMNLEFVFEKVG